MSVITSTGNTEVAWEVLCVAENRRARAVVAKVLGADCPASDIDDIVQQAALAAIEKHESFDPSRGKQAAWYLAVVRNCARMHRRAQMARWRRERPTGQVPETRQALGNPEQVFEIGERDAWLADCLQALPALERDCIEEFFLSRVSVSELAERAGTSRHTINSRLRRGLERLRKHAKDRRIGLALVLLALGQRPLAAASAPTEADPGQHRADGGGDHVALAAATGTAAQLRRLVYWVAGTALAALALWWFWPTPPPALHVAEAVTTASEPPAEPERSRQAPLTTPAPVLPRAAPDQRPEPSGHDLSGRWLLSLRVRGMQVPLVPVQLREQNDGIISDFFTEVRVEDGIFYGIHNNFAIVGRLPAEADGAISGDHYDDWRRRRKAGSFSLLRQAEGPEPKRAGMAGKSPF